ncbi:MAG TPA: (2Fe-2S)-binding protein [Mycobacteriales bacterium]|nr:(2Fe-2S)-binding protein [Mycobacteriales bacterium]
MAGAEVAAALLRAGATNPLLGIDLIATPAGPDVDPSRPGGAMAGPAVAGTAGPRPPPDVRPDGDLPAGPGAAVGDPAGPGLGAGLPGRPAGLLVGPGTGPAAAGELVDAVAGWLQIAERRVAGSLVVLGYAARLVGPAIAVLLRDGILVDLGPDRVRYDFAPGQGFRLALTGPAGWRGDPAGLADRWCRDVLDGHLGAVLASVQAAAPVATGLLWGNVASGLTGALRSVARGGGAPVRQCYQLGANLLRYGPLAGSGVLTADLGFVRRSCCLYYRLDGGGTCGDCPLR